MDTREQFEKWYLSKYFQGEEKAKTLFARNEDDSYLFQAQADAFEIWEASRQSIEIRMPALRKVEEWWTHRACRQTQDDIEAVLKAAGLKVLE